MVYTVKQLAALSGVSIRTLHYYDGIGLLKPSYIKENGYRCYEKKELLKLQQILFFKELDFPLEEIFKMLNAQDFNRNEALKDQKKLLLIKKSRIEKLIQTIDNNLKGGENMSNDDLFASFNDDELVENMKEAKSRWGHTDAYKQSVERTKNWTKADYELVKKEAEAFNKELASVMGKDINSDEVQSLIEKHYRGIQYFYDCPYDVYRGLGEMYVSDPRFTKTYDKVKPGLAVFLRNAISYYCDQHQQK